ncbi:MAG: phospholipase [Bacteroidaceae bacterium]|nr:phospholipase [Bacteroidaceae bacterium]MBQ9176822.1 phospholipase [Bacteroidaceae bacterium]
MIYLILSLILLAIVAALLGWLRNRRLHRQLERGEISQLPTLQQVEDMECCGQHEVCERDSLLAAVSKEIEYFDDEELDRFRGRSSSDYDEDETDEFREILYSMREAEVAAWVRSLQLRAVELPDALKPEVLLIVGERR